MFQSTPSPSHEKDRISELPDDLFTIILSHLPLREVARNSVISHRWRHLWKVTPRLELDYYKYTYKSLLTNTNKINYVEWVNMILESHECWKIHEVRIRYGLDNYKHFERDIDNWVKSLFFKQVQIFNLELGIMYDNRRRYSLTRELVETFVNQNFNGFQYLKELSLKWVNVSEDLLELILDKSPVLERLSIKGSSSLSVVRVCGPQCVLKFLEVDYDLKSLEISNVASLVSLKYSGDLPKVFIIKNVPMLTDFSFGGNMVIEYLDVKLNGLFTQLSSSLKHLTLNITTCVSIINFHRLPKMVALEKLVVQTNNSNSYTSIFACLTRLGPSLKEFVFQAHGHKSIALPDGNIMNLMIMQDQTYECLREVKILGYYGCTRDVNIALYFIQSAVALETIVIDPRDQSPVFYNLPPNTEIEQDARIRAKRQLKRKVPSRVNLVIL